MKNIKENHQFKGKLCAFVLEGGILLLLSGLIIPGCGRPKLSTTEEYIAFEKAGPVKPLVDMENITAARLPSATYRVVAGDVLELYMPLILQYAHIEQQYTTVNQPYLTRVSEEGKIIVPLLGEVFVAGQSLSHIEKTIIKGVYPRFFKKSPSVIAKVAEYRTINVSVVGAVEQPGVYPLKSNEKTLVTLLMKSGGIVKDGAAAIRIRHADGQDSQKPIVLPVEGLNIPFRDVPLADGDSVSVERLNPQVFTVIGLVRNAGAYPYPAGVHYNLLQALSFAGGLNEIADPRYVRVYRQDKSGRIVDATFKVRGGGITGASSITIKPGDVIAVEQTARTKFNILIGQIIRFQLGGTMYYRLDNRGSGL